MTDKLDGRVALVSGSGRGIGREIALKLASEGARLVINDLDADPANETAEAIRAAAARLRPHHPATNALPRRPTRPPCR